MGKLRHIAIAGFLAATLGYLGYQVHQFRRPMGGFVGVWVPPPPERTRQTVEEILAKHPALADWYARWQADLRDDGSRLDWTAFTGNSDRARKVAATARLVKKLELTPLELFDLADAMGSACLAFPPEHPKVLDILQPVQLIRLATDVVLASLEPTKVRREDRDVVRAMRQSQNVLWPAQDGRTIERQSTFLMRVEREADYDQTPEWAQLAVAEGLILQSKYKEASDQLGEIERAVSGNSSRFTAEQIVELHYARGMIACHEGRPQDAIADLAVAADSAAFHHSTDALQSLAIALARTGAVETADRRFVEWVHRAKPSKVEAVCFKAEIAVAHARSATSPVTALPVQRRRGRP